MDHLLQIMDLLIHSYDFALVPRNHKNTLNSRTHTEANKNDQIPQIPILDRNVSQY